MFAYRKSVIATAAALSLFLSSPVLAEESAPGFDADILFEQAEALRTGDGVAKNESLSLELFRQLAMADNLRALTRLGYMYSRGIGTDINLSEAETAYRRAVDLGYTYGLIGLADVLVRQGRGADALATLEKARNAGEEDRAALAIAQGHFLGDFGADSDGALGLAQLSDLHDAGEARASRLLGEAYFEGELVPRDLARSLDYLRPLAASGDARAAERVGDILNQPGASQSDLRRASENYRIAVDGGRTGVLLDMAEIALALGDGPEARRLFEEAEKAGLDRATTRLAAGDLSDDFGPATDPEAGLRRLEDLAEAGDERAAFDLADAYRRGEQINVDMQKSFDLFQELAAKGNARAMERVGYILSRGLLGETDHAAAVAAFQGAIDAGLDRSRLYLASSLVELGAGEDALAALQAAADLGVEDAPLEIARGHARGDFGAASDRKFGVEALREAFAAGALDEGRSLVEAFEGGAIPGVDRAAVLTLVASRTEEGRDIQAALRLLRDDPPRSGGAALRETLLDYGRPLLEPDELLEEEVYILSDKPFSRRKTEDLFRIVNQLDSGPLTDVFKIVHRTDRRAFTYLLQVWLRDNGYYSAPISATMSGPTLRAILNFCRDRGIIDSCRQGPLRSEAAHAIIDEIAETGFAQNS